MFQPPLNLKKARILVTNDDGYQAHGIKILEKVAHDLSDDVWVVAPETEQSAVSHSLTIRRPLRIRKVRDQFYAVDGTEFAEQDRAAERGEFVAELVAS